VGLVGYSTGIGILSTGRHSDSLPNGWQAGPRTGIYERRGSNSFPEHYVGFLVGNAVVIKPVVWRTIPLFRHASVGDKVLFGPFHVVVHDHVSHEHLEFQRGEEPPRTGENRSKSTCGGKRNKKTHQAWRPCPNASHVFDVAYIV